MGTVDRDDLLAACGADPEDAGRLVERPPGVLGVPRRAEGRATAGHPAEDNLGRVLVEVVDSVAARGEAAGQMLRRVEPGVHAAAAHAGGQPLGPVEFRVGHPGAAARAAVDHPRGEARTRKHGLGAKDDAGQPRTPQHVLEVGRIRRRSRHVPGVDVQGLQTRDPFEHLGEARDGGAHRGAGAVEALEVGVGARAVVLRKLGIGAGVGREPGGEVSGGDAVVHHHALDTRGVERVAPGHVAVVITVVAVDVDRTVVAVFADVEGLGVGVVAPPVALEHPLVGTGAGAGSGIGLGIEGHERGGRAVRLTHGVDGGTVFLPGAHVGLACRIVAEGGAFEHRVVLKGELGELVQARQGAGGGLALARHVPAGQIQGGQAVIAREGAVEPGDVLRVPLLRPRDGLEHGATAEHVRDVGRRREVEMLGLYIDQCVVVLEPAGRILHAHAVLEDHMLHHMGVAFLAFVAGRRRQGAPGQVLRDFRDRVVAALGTVIADREGLGADVVLPPDVLVVEAAAQDLLPVIGEDGVGLGAALRVESRELARAIGPLLAALGDVAGPGAVVGRALSQRICEPSALQDGSRARRDLQKRTVSRQHVENGGAGLEVPFAEVNGLKRGAALEHVGQVRASDLPVLDGGLVLEPRAALEHRGEVLDVLRLPEAKGRELGDARAALEHRGHGLGALGRPILQGDQVVVAEGDVAREDPTHVLDGARVPCEAGERRELLVAREEARQARGGEHVHARAIEGHELVVVLEPADGVADDDAALGGDVSDAVLRGLKGSRSRIGVAVGGSVTQRLDPGQVLGRIGVALDDGLRHAGPEDELLVLLHVLPPGVVVGLEPAAQEGVVPPVGELARVGRGARVAPGQTAGAVEPGPVGQNPSAVARRALRQVVVHAGVREDRLLARDEGSQGVPIARVHANHVGAVGRALHIPGAQVEGRELAVAVEHAREVLDRARVPTRDRLV